MKLSEILKQQGVFSQDVKARIKNRQIFINGEPISEDIEINCTVVKNKFDEDVADAIEAGDLLLNIVKNKAWKTQIQILGFESLFDSNIENDLVLLLKKHILLKISKKQVLILTKKDEAKKS